MTTRDKQLYRKYGRRYVPVGREFTGWPMDGVWLVLEDQSRHICRLGDVPNPFVLASIEAYRDVVVDALVELPKSWEETTIEEVITEVFRVMAGGGKCPDAK